MTVPIPHLTRPKRFKDIRRLARRMMEKATPQPMELNVHLAFDAEADVWYVAATDVPGLSLEADNPQRLIDRIVECAPRLIELNAEKLPGKRATTKKRALAVRPVFDSPMLVDA